MSKIEMTLEEFNKKGEELFGEDRMKWKWKCPLCDFIATTQDYKDAGASPDSVGFSCIGRFKENPKKAISTKNLRGNGPCNYRGGGLFNFNPIRVIHDDVCHDVFEFSID